MVARNSQSKHNIDLSA